MQKSFNLFKNRELPRNQTGTIIYFTATTTTWGAGMAQWWEHSPPTNVARVRFPDSASYVGWVAPSLSLLRRHMSLRKPDHRFQIKWKKRPAKNYLSPQVRFTRTSLFKILIYFKYLLKTNKNKTNKLYLTRVTLNSEITDKPVALGFQIELEFGNVGFWGEGKTGEPGEKPLGARTRTNAQPLRHPCSS